MQVKTTPKKNNWMENVISSNLATPSSSQILDMDNDNDLDVVTIFDLSGSLIWYEQNKSNFWTPHLISNNVTEAVEFTSGDFNNDGILDFALGSFNNGYLAILENQNNGLYSFHSYPYSSFTSVEAADIDGDGDLDILTSSYEENRVDWWRNNHMISDILFINGFE